MSDKIKVSKLAEEILDKELIQAIDGTEIEEIESTRSRHFFHCKLSTDGIFVTGHFSSISLIVFIAAIAAVILMFKKVILPLF
jgi:hypothetical protein